MGKTNGTAFVDITNPRKPRLVAYMPTQAEGSRRFWRDIKVYKDHAFVVSEHFNHGMQVFDLTRLRRARGDAGALRFRPQLPSPAGEQTGQSRSPVRANAPSTLRLSVE